MTTKIPAELSSTPGIVDNSDATAITITSDEEVGIGTTTPNSYAFNDPAKLVVANTSGNSTLSIVSGTTSIGYLAFADGTSGTARYPGSLQYNHNSSYMSFHTNDGTERMRILSGGGITFNGDSATANALDDYEEGTWTPTFAGVAVTNLYGATYIKIGRQVIAECYINGNTQNNTNQFRLAGLPYTATSDVTYGGGSISYSGSIDLSEFAAPIIAPGTNYAYFHYIDGSQSGNSVTNNVLYGKEAGNILLIIQLIYRSAS